MDLDKAAQTIADINRESMGKEKDSMSLDNLEDLDKALARFNRLIGGFCHEDIPDLCAMTQTMDQIIHTAKEMDTTLYEVALACSGYIEHMTQEHIYDTTPIEEGALLLRSILNHIRKKEAFTFDFSDVLELLNIRFMEHALPEGNAAEAAQVPPVEDTDWGMEPEDSKEPGQEIQEKISDDDMEILSDFISEAKDNLDSIEVNLIELEQDPGNKDIINDIFRPFHTIKGVSGFLSLTKINKLAHTTENLLDSARSGDFEINPKAIDAILASVDTLKRLVERVREGVSSGFRQPEDDIDVESLRDRLKKLQLSLTHMEKEPIGEILVNKGVISRENLDECLEMQKETPDRKIGEILMDETRLESKYIASALMEQNLPRKQVASQVKVSTQKLDDLVDFAGELVIAQSMLRQKTMGNALLNQSVTQLGQIVTNMQNIAMSMRMIPIKATFMKMIRLVRDLAQKSGKEVNLEMSGEDTEIDRNVVDALYEPMVHMIRNSVDHGIELGPDRLDKGKTSQGTVYLRAYHKGGHIIIEIEDDGRGLDKERILEKAKSTGLVSGNEQMTDAQIYDLILQPGFSTAKQITDVSGRGVGMDVVKDGIEKFRGQLNIESEKGKGTRFTISLPLTLAIIDGMLVRVGQEKYVVPTTAIQKAFKPGPKECYTVEGKGEIVRDRGNLIPLIRLDEIFGNGRGNTPVQESLVVIVESKDETRALLIDELLGKDEYVIKSLGGNMEEIKGLAGGAILSDGRVGLILDIHGIFSLT